ncbi:MAG: DUF47 family protein [Anaerolineae bacterium]|nr:DUF47 family protein [Anaerolineae bacterium]
MKLGKIFKRKPNKFLQLLLEQTKLTMQGLELLTRYLKKRNSDIAKEIHDTEHTADEMRRILIEELMNTFATPFDREDIFSLSRAIDDVLDYANTTVEEMEILDVSPTPPMVNMATLLYEASREFELAIERLQTNHLKVAGDHAQGAKAIENQVEVVYREALADLFQEPKNLKHMMTILKVREIYRHLSNAADREDEAANIVADIVMKMS